ncbi:MAG: hypothetical protein AB1512_28135 [Thermodesulfobacteriota bacterium]
MTHRSLEKAGVLIVALLTLLLFFYPVLFLGKTFFLRDIQCQFYPMKHYLASSLKSGLIPWWCSYQYCGAPFLSDIQSGVFYPLSLLFAILPFPFSFNLYVVTHFFLGFCFIYNFIREMGLSRPSALFVGISYCYGGYMIASVISPNHLSTMIWLPAILWGIQRWRDRRRLSDLCITLFFLVMSVLGGEPQLFLMAAALALFYALIVLPSPPISWVDRAKSGAVVATLILAALLLTAAQWMPTYVDYQYSARFQGIPYEEAVRFSLSPGMLKHLFLPLAFPSSFVTDPRGLDALFPSTGQMPMLLTVYPGFLILPLFLLGLRPAGWRMGSFWAAGFILSGLLALGRHSPAYSFFYGLFPFFRFPEKFMFIAGFCLLVPAAQGFEHVLSHMRRKGWRAPYWGVLLLAVLLLDLHFHHRHLNPTYESTFYSYFHPSLQPILNDRDVFRVYVDEESSVLPPQAGSILDQHIRWQTLLMPNLGMLHPISQVAGRTGLELRYQYFITELLRKPWPERIRFLRLANVKYIVTAVDLAGMPELKGQVSRVGGLVFRVRDYLPRAWLVGKAEGIGAESIDRLVDPSFDPATSALVKRGVADRHTRPRFGKVEEVTYEPQGRIRVRVRAERPGILVLSESSYPGWRVFVDGAERDCLWLDLLFQGVEVEEGDHLVEFVFRPKYSSLTAPVSLICTALFLALWIAAFLRPISVCRGTSP